MKYIAKEKNLLDFGMLKDQVGENRLISFVKAKNPQR